MWFCSLKMDGGAIRPIQALSITAMLLGHTPADMGKRCGLIQSMRPQQSEGNLRAEPDTFWGASAQIMAELAALLPPGAVCAWVLKAYVSARRPLCPFPNQWRALCEAHGFVLVEEIHASLVEHHGTQEGLFGEAEVIQTARKSFFRRLYEKRPGAAKIDYEVVLILSRS